MIGVIYTVGATLIIVIRSSHPAMVCSGDHLSDLEKENDVLRVFYEIETGYFLYVMMIIQIVYLALSCLCCLGLCCGIASY